MSDPPDNVPDVRLYVPEPEDYEPKIKTNWEKEYCFLRNPGEDYFHTLIGGEMYLQRGSEKYCLRCALRRGMITQHRLNWQRRTKSDVSDDRF